MKKEIKRRVILWVFVIVMFTAISYLYVGNPLKKEYNLGLYGLIFSTLYIAFRIFFRKSKEGHEISLLTTFGILIFSYLVFL